LMSDMKLQFGAIDLALTQSGNYYFLEINPNGQWLWIEDKLGYPISQAVADWLVGNAR
jgi:glutathione synthase/RimK-type ligase-like ATP-grasp enzyme